ncbi:hypothetical protein T492DRAFT_1114155 [Pavlovales sp. CCMP2436]|nr:hypothetical protein T492DRAFT_1114155 [Pavlovales sp. CCMP2436]
MSSLFVAPMRDSISVLARGDFGAETGGRVMAAAPPGAPVLLVRMHTSSSERVAACTERSLKMQREAAGDDDGDASSDEWELEGKINVGDLLSVLGHDNSVGSSAGTRAATMVTPTEMLMDFDDQCSLLRLVESNTDHTAMNELSHIVDGIISAVLKEEPHPSDFRGTVMTMPSDSSVGQKKMLKSSGQLDSLREQFHIRFVTVINVQVNKRMVKRKRANLPAEAIEELTAFVEGKRDNPYASPQEKEQLARKCDISRDQTRTTLSSLLVQQVSNWLTNYRKRRWIGPPPKCIKVSVAGKKAGERAALQTLQI